MKLASLLFVATLTASPVAAKPVQDFDLLIVHGRVFDGTGASGRAADVGVRGDRIVAVGHLAGRHARRVVDAHGLAVAPGFINMLSQAGEDLMLDGLSQADIRQGVTLEMLGEGMTAGPLSPTLKDFMHARMARLGAGDLTWTTQADYMRLLIAHGVSPNIASFVGATNVRRVVIGDGDRKATEADIKAMQELVRQAMDDGAFGVSSALAYAPAAYADTAELTALAKASAPWDGLYISHLRDEGDALPAGVDELIRIARDAGVKGEVYHFKVTGVQNAPKLEQAIAALAAARRLGVRVGADAYPYTATATGLDVTMPLWVQAGGQQAWIDRLKDPSTRAKVAEEMRHPPPGTTSRLQAVGSPANIRILGVRNPALKPLVGQSVAQIAKARGTPPEETIIDLVVEDNSRLQVAYFSIPEDGMRRVMRLPWVSFGSDGGSTAAPSKTPGAAHPREFGTFARVLGHEVRDEKLIDLPQAVHRLSGLPAANLGLKDRGLLKAGYFADIVVFDPDAVADRATYDQPFQYSVGVRDVFVNGVQVLAGGEHTGAKPGRFIRNGGRKP
ncbi:MAG: amidohydrolase family protein [Proteobacteria bacterium]|nr:amidohydrolase family protein [Pseudomonadota bacterium]